MVILKKGRVKKQVQHNNKNLKNSSFGVEKFNFSLGRLLIFNCTEWIYSSVMSLKSVPLGMYCRVSLFVFSMAPFCQDELESAKNTGAFSNFEMIPWREASMDMFGSSIRET